MRMRDSTSAARTGLESGMTIYAENRMSRQPSISAALVSSRGRLAKQVRATIVFQMDTPIGRDQNERGPCVDEPERVDQQESRHDAAAEE